MHSAIWRMTYHMEFLTLVFIAVGAFILLAWRRTRTRRTGSRRGGFRYRKRYGRSQGRRYNNDD